LGKDVRRAAKGRVGKYGLALGLDARLFARQTLGAGHAVLLGLECGVAGREHFLALGFNARPLLRERAGIGLLRAAGRSDGGQQEGKQE
jgi:hypothetical protein